MSIMTEQPQTKSDVSDISLRARRFARVIDRLPAGNYSIRLVKDEIEAINWNVEIVRDELIRKLSLARNGYFPE